MATYAEIAQAMLNSGFPQSAIPTGVAIVMAESGGQPVKSRVDPNSWGPWQINLDVHPLSVSQANDLQSATDYAYKLYSEQGWSPWSAYTTGEFKQYLGGGGGSPTAPMSPGGPMPDPRTDEIAELDRELGTIDAQIQALEQWGKLAEADPAGQYSKNPTTISYYQQLANIEREMAEHSSRKRELEGQRALLMQQKPAELQGTSAQERQLAGLVERGVISQGQVDQLVLAGLLQGLGGGTSQPRTEFASEQRLRTAQADEIYAKLADRPLANKLAVIEQEIAAGRLKRDLAADIWQREIDRAAEPRKAFDAATTGIARMGGGFVPAEPLNFQMSGLKTEPQPFGPIVQAFNPNLPSDPEQQAYVQSLIPQLQQKISEVSGMTGGA